MKNDNIDVSIIIVNYNSGELLYNCISSLIKFTKEVSYEIIVIDNNSKDKSLEKVEYEFPHKVKIIQNQENKGFGKANNQGLKVATGKYILFLNNDTIFVEDTLFDLINYLKNSDERLLIAPKLLNKDGTLQYSVYSFQTLWLTFTTYFFLYSLFPKSEYFNRYYLMNRGITGIMEVEGITGAFMLFSRKDILDLNGFDEDFFFYGEDNDLCKRFRDLGGKIIYFPKTKVVHLKGGTDKTNWFHEKYHFLSILKLFNKHFSFFKRKLAFLFLYTGFLMRSIILFFGYLLTLNKNYKLEAKLKLKLLLITLKSRI